MKSFVLSHLKHPIHFSLFVTAVLIFIPFSFSAASDTLIINSDMQYQFAKEYYRNGDYLKAIDEFQRFIYFFPKDNRVSDATFLTGMAYLKSNRFKEAILYFEEIIDKYPGSELYAKSFLMMSEGYINLKALLQAVFILEKLIAATNDANIKDEAYYRIGWIYLDSASWEKASENFAKIGSENKLKYRLKELSAEIEKADFISQKNPAVAGVLSIIPGAGFLYCERYQDALAALLLNGGLIAAGYESFHKEHYALGGIVSLIGAGFYLGNIYGAVSSAHKYNKAHTTDFIQRVKQKTKVHFSALPEKSGFLFSVHYPF